MGAGRRGLKPPETGGNTELDASEDAVPNEKEPSISQATLGQHVYPGARTSLHQRHAQKLFDKNRNT